MAITARVPLLLLLGLVAVLLRPAGSTVWLWLLVVVALVGVDVFVAPSPGSLSLQRVSPGRVRAGEETTSVLVVENTGRRRASLLVRDAWQPSACAHDNRHRLRLGAGDRVTLTT